MSRLNRARTQLKHELATYARERGYLAGASARKALPQAKSTGKPAKNADKPQIDNDNTKE